MKDERKTKKQLIAEMVQLRQRVAELQAEEEEDHKQVEEALILARARLEHLITHSPAVIYACEPSGDYAATSIGDNVREQLGYEPEDFVGDPKFWADHIHPEDAPRVLAGLHRLFEHDDHTHEYRFQHKDGTYRWLRDDKGLPGHPEPCGIRQAQS